MDAPLISITTGDVSAESVSYIAGAITEIFKAGFESHQSEAVMLAALKALDVVRPVSTGHTISHCNLSNKDIS